jgi:hypothetical protein
MSKEGPILEITREEAETLATALENVYFSLAQKYQGQKPEVFFDGVSNLRTRVKDFLSPRSASRETLKAEIIKRFDESDYAVERIWETVGDIADQVGIEFGCPPSMTDQAVNELTLVCFLKRKKGGMA